MKHAAVICSLAVIALATPLAAPAKPTPAWSSGRPQPGLIARISRAVFGPRAATAACIAHFESTDGAKLYNRPNLGPWQIDVDVHTWVSASRVVSDWWYAARVAYRLSRGGSDWSPWSTHGLCGV